MNSKLSEMPYQAAEDSAVSGTYLSTIAAYCSLAGLILLPSEAINRSRNLCSVFS